MRNIIHAIYNEYVLNEKNGLLALSMKKDCVGLKILIYIDTKKRPALGLEDRYYH